MCIATIYDKKNDKLEFITQDIVSLEVSPTGILVTSLLGEKMSIEGKIRQIDFLKHTVILESIKN